MPLVPLHEIVCAIFLQIVHLFAAELFWVLVVLASAAVRVLSVVNAVIETQRVRTSRMDLLRFIERLLKTNFGVC